MTTQLPEIAQALLNPSIYPDKPSKVDLIQTQMSFVFIAGKYVYKLKKPVNLGYLDYSTLERRHYFCKQEVALNRRLSPEVYLGVTPVTYTKSGFALGGRGKVVDYAVKMVHLPQDRMLNVLLERFRATAQMLDQVAEKMVDFHRRAATNPEKSAFGKVESIKANTEENYSQTEKYFDVAITAREYQQIKDFTNRILTEKKDLFEMRVANGRIRDCHGDLHSQHICFSGTLSIIDCIEFNDRFRYCDVASEIAFLAMDVDHFGRADLSRSFIDSYIRLSNDPQIDELLKFYKCYRAYVRGKVNCFKFEDPYIGDAERKIARETARSYFDLAQAYTRSKPLLFITVGLVGSGKTTVSNALAKRLGLTVISSDAVRKQLANIPLTERHFNEIDSGLYSAEFSKKTYDKVLEEARRILNRGEHIILDATFIHSDDRLKAKKLAEEFGTDLVVVECRLDETIVKERLAQRLKGNSISDGRWEIYEPQKQKFEAVVSEETGQYFVVDTGKPLFNQLSPIIEGI